MTPEEQAHFLRRQRDIAQSVLSWVADGEYDDLSRVARSAHVSRALDTVIAVSKQLGDWPLTETEGEQE